MHSFPAHKCPPNCLVSLFCTIALNNSYVWLLYCRGLVSVLRKHLSSGELSSQNLWTWTRYMYLTINLHQINSHSKKCHQFGERKSIDLKTECGQHTCNMFVVILNYMTNLVYILVWQAVCIQHSSQLRKGRQESRLYTIQLHEDHYVKYPWDWGSSWYLIFQAYFWGILRIFARFNLYVQIIFIPTTTVANIVWFHKIVCFDPNRG